MIRRADTGKETQFYTMLGTRGIWHDGWFANTVHAASPAGWSNFDKDRWELFHIEADRSQCHDLAAEKPDKLEELKALWFAEAAKYNGLPLADLNILETLTRFRPYLSGDREDVHVLPGHRRVGMGAAVEIRGQSFSVLAEVTVDTAGAEGVMFKQGGGHGGHVLFVQDGTAALHLQLHRRGGAAGRRRPTRCRLGSHVFGVRYDADRHGRGQPHPARRRGALHRRRRRGATAGRAVPSRHVRARRRRRRRRAQHRSAVSRSYKAPFAFTGGTIAKVNVDVSGKPYLDVERELARAFAKD